MELIRGLHNFAPRHRGSVVSIGNFDGLHRGHQALIARLRTLAVQHRVPVTVVCFEPMPREFFQGAAAPPRIADLRGKLRDLALFGVERVVVLPFGARLAAMSAQAFVQQVLVDGLGARAVIVGDDFRYGSKRVGDLALLKAIGAVEGFSAEGLGTVELEGERCSSTVLRAALAQPDLDKVERLLDRRYRIVGRVRHGLKLGRQLGMPTANVHLRRPPALAHGVYAVRLAWPGAPEGLPGVASLGVRPTLGLTACLLETHVFDLKPDLYGQEVVVEFHKFLRPQLKFDDLDTLAAQMQADGLAARAHFSQDLIPS
ncbi:bifunctional riboflavin kinase/FAD synthetase [Nevskia ramosa]|uniref:bifunctional riboflavin kinase/FAD synthetase n=1 Tax=Nevskia ramosa TaxID=64002 RepID=UPI0003B61B2A|nr:bifunctional riboflavin kinase/FAD synthetase [Nevskia ramosa]